MPPSLHTWRWLIAPTLLIGLLCAHLVVNHVWIRADRTLRGEDMGTQLAAVAHAHGLLDRGPLPPGYEDHPVAFVLRGEQATQWPSASTLPWAALGLLLGLSIPMLQLANMGPLAILLGCILHLGSRLSSVWSGLLAAFLFSFFPIVFGISRHFSADLPGAAMTALSLSLLVESRMLRRLLPSLGFGLCVGIGVLVRPHSLFFVLFAALLPVLLVLRRPGSTGRVRVLGHAVLASVVAAGTCAPWWWDRLPQIVGLLRFHQEAAPLTGDEGWAALTFYIRHLPAALSPLMTVALVPALILFVRRSLGQHACCPIPSSEPLDAPSPTSRQEVRILVIAWLVSGFFLVTWSSVKQIRYLLPMLPALALAISDGLLAPSRRVLRRSASGLLVGLMGLLWLLCSLGALVQPGALCEQEPARTLLSRQCGDPRYGGPPAKDGAYLAAQRAASAMERATAPVTEGAALVLTQDPGPDLHPLVVAKALFMYRMPTLLLEGIPFEEQATNPGPDPVHFFLGGAAFPRPGGPHRRCFALHILNDDRSPRLPRAVPDGQRLILSHRTCSRGRPLLYALVQYEVCPGPP